eukprot:scaffold21738_cov24-Tisochrysis_lutea.AAC.1
MAKGAAGHPQSPCCSPWPSGHPASSKGGLHYSESGLAGPSPSERVVLRSYGAVDQVDSRPPPCAPARRWTGPRLGRAATHSLFSLSFPLRRPSVHTPPPHQFSPRERESLSLSRPFSLSLTRPSPPLVRRPRIVSSRSTLVALYSVVVVVVSAPEGVPEEEEGRLHET